MKLGKMAGVRQTEYSAVRDPKFGCSTDIGKENVKESAFNNRRGAIPS
jgi:hypothetical protein